jgi:BMFP domain-containing protein YqiC
MSGVDGAGSSLSPHQKKGRTLKTTRVNNVDVFTRESFDAVDPLIYP